MSTRQAIATALSLVDGVNPSTSPPDVPAPGSAWPTWVSAAPGTYAGLFDTWHVYVCLPNATMAQTVESGDPWLLAVWAALLDVGEVGAADAATISVGDPAGTGQPLPALRFTLTTAGSRS